MARFLVVVLATAFVGLLTFLPPGSVQGTVIGNATLDENCTSPSDYSLNPGEAFKFKTENIKEANCVMRFDAENCSTISFKCNKFEPETKEFLTIFHADNKTVYRHDDPAGSDPVSFNVSDTFRIKYTNNQDQDPDSTSMKCIVRCTS